jgi:hypothetical protein
MTYQCSRDLDPKCAFEPTRSGVRLVGLPPDLVASAYLAVFCSWSIPPDEQVPDGGAEAAASWLFRVELDAS